MENQPVLEMLAILTARYPELAFVAGKSFYWSPETREVYYDKTAVDDSCAGWSLLHETCHGLLEHTTYQADVELLQLEVAAWQRARQLASELQISIAEDHIQDCLDTYRDWLYRRSLCPGCGTQCLQDDNDNRYRCFNCHARWRVSPSRFCRAYRRSQPRAALPVFALQHYK